MAANLVTDIEQLRQHDKAAEIDITAIVQKHIAPNATRKDVERLLLRQDFTLHEQPEAADKTRTLIAIRKEKGLIASLGFHDEIRVVIIFDNDKVKQASGLLIYRAL
ncbi:hypothetical protein C9I28_09230 [Pseudoduganella armeniaca]|uniref:Uncharacterized protein n=2 Tax=Pseudoduganella armeniaca TaxID=2072590 RepID=A0A2R4C8E1_9BURK|nr:hypothetical protein C9I28_09230 [Pseudoduganella armeniaca]